MKQCHSSGGWGKWQCRVKPSLPVSHHAVHAAHRPCLRFQLPAEELAEVPVVVQILHSRLLHVHPEGPDVQAVHRLPQPRGQLHLVQAAPGSREQPRRDRLVQGNLSGERQRVSASPLMPSFLLTQKGSDCSCKPLPWIHVAFKAAKNLHCTSSSFPPFWWDQTRDRMKLYKTLKWSHNFHSFAGWSSTLKLLQTAQCEAYRKKRHYTYSSTTLIRKA